MLRPSRRRRNRGKSSCRLVGQSKAVLSTSKPPRSERATPAPSARRGPRQRLAQAVGEGGLDVTSRCGGVALIDGLAGNRLGESLPWALRVSRRALN